ncbi:hypothetical protein FEM48_Zijuj01G0148900 [Ziziphus jujuba var. spinosa]|uniref:Amidase domain-containing protein n=1 Tax=Ziziphus jujuba var. spinosa TaxID=714518 RepID=A0A978UAG1_ZIZJJ|nr:hypothetical protein FEM48_Zijuj12G0016300 [Ziziphus jujuba var. spinosa]KAH7545953.1 hypothetical protein FEM48_Zijuj01G0148900 [Ziziphus jujuba var. spinosa]
MGGGQLCPVDHFIPNEGDKSDPSGDWVTFVPPSSLRSISGHPLRSIVDLASPSPSKHRRSRITIPFEASGRRKKLDFGGKLPFEAFLAGEFIFCCILPLFHRSAIITWTRNPWNIEEFSTGSSAGPAACTSAGMVPFAIGSETVGSMTLPAARCGVTALRPTFGIVGRADDLSSKDISLDDPFSIDITKLSVGYLDDADMEVVHVLASKGVKMFPFELKYAVDSVQGIVNFTMDVDMLAHFDEWQRLGQDDDYESQDQWPTELRRACVFPAVDYVQAQRSRGKLIQEVRESFTVDALIGSATDWERVCMGNLVGLPVIVVPTAFTNISNPPSTDCLRRTAVTTGIYAPPYQDSIVLALAMAYQSVTDHHRQRPPVDDLGLNDSIPNPPTVTYPPRLLHL